MEYPVLLPQNQWFSKGGLTTPKSTFTEIHIKDTYIPSGEVTAQWDASEAQNGSITVYVEGTKITIAGNGSGKIQTNKDSKSLFSDADKNNRFSNADIFGLELLDISKTEILAFAFRASKLTSIDFFKKWDFSSLKIATALFYECINLTGNLNLTDMNFPELEDICSMFSKTGFETISLINWNTPKLKYAAILFQYAEASKIYIDNIDFGQVLTMGFFCAKMKKLKEFVFKNTDTSACEDLSSFFQYCDSLEYVDVSNFNTQSAIVLSRMFERCPNLKKIDGLQNFNTEKVGRYKTEIPNGAKFFQTGLAFMFQGCLSLTEVDLSSFKCVKINPAYDNEYFPKTPYMFAQCESLKSIKFNQEFHTSDTRWMFKDCKSLTNLEIGNLKLEGCYFFQEMFFNCASLETLDLSSWDTNKGLTSYLKDVFTGCNKLSKVILGENFNYHGQETTQPPYISLNTPDPTFIPGADGNWYDITGKAYTPEDAVKTVPNTYYASKTVLREQPVVMKNGTVSDIGQAIRDMKNDGLYRYPNEMAEAIRGISSPSDEIVTQAEALMGEWY